jgi:hypothetical protein
MKNQETKKLKKAKLFVEFYQKFNSIAVFKNFGAVASNFASNFASNAIARMYPTNSTNNMMLCCCC